MEKPRTNAKKSAEKCAQQLIKIHPYVLADDRKAAMAKYSIAYVTICRYLKGDVPNLVLGLKLLAYFTKQKEQREDELSRLIK